jgi:hypothetical protein
MNLFSEVLYRAKFKAENFCELIKVLLSERNDLHLKNLKSV